MRVALSAFLCEPGSGSENGVGWSWALAAAERHDVTLLTGTQSRDLIVAALAERPGIRITPLFLSASPGGDKPWTSDTQLRRQYIEWQLRLGRRLKELHRAKPFDVTHHVTLSADWMPAGSLSLSEVPSVWGPVGGLTGSHWSLSRWLGRGYFTQEVARFVMTGAGRAGFGRRQLRRADVVVVQNDDVAAWARRSGAEIVVEPHPGLDESEMARGRASRVPRPPGRRTAVFCGRLITWKGLLLAIHALSRPAAAEWRLDVIGAGPDAERAQALAISLGVADRVTMVGRIDRTEVLSRMANADAILMPTVHDSACWVVAEASALGRPVVCLDSGGPPTVLRLAVPDAAWSGVVDCSGDVPAKLAAALATVPTELPASDRWSMARIPDLLDEWYALARDHARTRGTVRG